LGYTATDHNIYYRDTMTNRIKISTYCTFDKAGMTLTPTKRSPSATTLQHLGVKSHVDTTETDTQDNTQEPCTAKIILLSDHAKIPTRATDGSAGYDLYSPRDTIIKPGQRVIIPTHISITPPEGTYIQIHPRSSLAAKYNIDTKAGVIDADFIGNITVVLQNSGQHDFHITMGDRIAQIIYTKISTPQHTLVPTLDQTQGGTQLKQHSYNSTNRSKSSAGTKIGNPNLHLHVQ
jgi:dUTP pyrophosphatase